MASSGKQLSRTYNFFDVCPDQLLSGLIETEEES